MFLAMLRDRIDMRDGQPEKYGTQMDSNGQLAPLLDASHVNELLILVDQPSMTDRDEGRIFAPIYQIFIVR